MTIHTVFYPSPWLSPPGNTHTHTHARTHVCGHTLRTLLCHLKARHSIAILFKMLTGSTWPFHRIKRGFAKPDHIPFYPHLSVNHLLGEDWGSFWHFSKNTFTALSETYHFPWNTNLHNFKSQLILLNLYWFSLPSKLWKGLSEGLSTCKRCLKFFLIFHVTK